MGYGQGQAEELARAAPAPADGTSSLRPSGFRDRARPLLNGWRRSALLQLFARDRVLALVTSALALVAILPMFVTPFLPLADLPDHTAQGALIPEILLNRGLAAHHYKLQWVPVPYWTTHVIVALLTPIVGALVAAKVMVGIAVLALPLAVMRVLVALGRDARLGLWAFLLSWDHNLYLGWTAFALGMSIALWGVAWLLEARSMRQAVRLALLAGLLGVTHIQAVAYFGSMLVVLLLVQRPLKRALLIHLVAGTGLLVSVVPWLVRHFSHDGQLVRPKFTFVFHDLREKLGSLFKYSLDNQPTPTWTGLAFLVLLLGPLVLASLTSKTEAGDRHEPPRQPTHSATAALLFLVPLALYLLVPWSLSGPLSHWYTYARYATFTMAALLFLPRARFSGLKALWLLPGVAMALVLNVSITAQFANYSQRARPFLEVIAHVEPNSSYLPLQLDDADPAMYFPPFSQIHAYIAAVKHGYDPHLFDNDSIPFLYRPEHRLPQPAWNQPGSFNLQEHGRHYDYVLVQGLAHDPIPRASPNGSVRARLVVEAGRFRLYAMDRNPG